MARNRRNRRREEEEGEGTPAPDPLKHSSADMDEARASVGGGVSSQRGRDDLDEGEEISEEELAAAAAEAGSPRGLDRGDEGIAKEAERAAAGEKRKGGVVTFLKACVAELKRVQWPDRRQVGQATAVTLGFVVIAGGYLGLMDAIWQPLVEAILGT